MLTADDFFAEMKCWRQPHRAPGAGGAAPRQPPDHGAVVQGLFYFILFSLVARGSQIQNHAFEPAEQPGRGLAPPRPPPRSSSSSSEKVNDFN